ncbi:hypothetical protein, partial [Endozoicomonas sp. SESOKO3]|uniref:hypothetical protein n=1 Tax=Endozoicomonas sp. SESOKO3 TaxID=2828744 RepID=UPI0021491934
MTILQLHKRAAITCLALVPVGFIVGGYSDAQEQTDLGIKFIFMLIGAYLPFYILRCIHLGRISTSQGHVLSMEKEPYLFWPFIGAHGILSLTIFNRPFNQVGA